MNETDKIIHQLNHVALWLRAGKDDETIRSEMYSAAAKTCRDLCERIEKLQQSA